jgi:hypothetical protein
MQFVSALAVVTGLAVVAVAPKSQVELPRQEVAVEAGSVRFTNNTEGTATVTANGSALFTDVAAGETTRWAEVSDSTVTFVLKIASAPNDSAWATQRIAEGGRYSLVGGTGEDGKPTLSVEAAKSSDSQEQ